MNIYKILLMLLQVHAQSGTLRRVLDSFGAAIDVCGNAIAQAEESGNPDYIDAIVDDECAVVEDLVGAAFVAGQAELTTTISHVMRLHRRAQTDGHALMSSDGTKAGILGLGGVVRAGVAYTDVQAINAFANYFKHHDEWTGAWANLHGQSRQTADTITAFGATEGSTGNLRQGLHALGIAYNRNVSELSTLVENWRRKIIGAYEAELKGLGLL